MEISNNVRSLIKNLRTKKVIIGRTRSFRKEKRYNSLSVNTVENFTPARVEPMTIIASGVVVTPMVENRLTACCGADIEKINADGEECGEDSGGEKLLTLNPVDF